jgi:hypothetical protein
MNGNAVGLVALTLLVVVVFVCWFRLGREALR